MNLPGSNASRALRAQRSRSFRSSAAPEMRDHVVLLVEQRHPGIQIGNDDLALMRMLKWHGELTPSPNPMCLPSSVKCCRRLLARSATVSTGCLAARVHDNAVRAGQLAGFLAQVRRTCGCTCPLLSYWLM